MATDDGMDHHAICRACGTEGDLLTAEESGGRTWIKLTCGHWQRAPHPGEFVLSQDGRYEVWGSFEYDEADL